MRLNRQSVGRVVLRLFCADGSWATQTSAQGDTTVLCTDSEIPLNKLIKNMTELRYRSVIRQQQDFSCGVTVVGTLLRYGHGLDIDERRVITDMMKASNPKQVAK